MSPKRIIVPLTVLFWLAVLSLPAQTNVTFTPPVIDVSGNEIVNPGRGFYYWIFQETAPVPCIDRYSRLNWSDIETSPGVYNFQVISNAAELARTDPDGNGTFGFGVRCVVEGVNKAYPAYLDAGMQAWYATNKSCWVPDWNNTNFLARVEALNTALSNSFGGDPRIGFVEIRTYGNWGEWHLSGFPNPPAPLTAITTNSIRRIIDSHATSFPARQLIMMGDNAVGLGYAMDKTNLAYPIGWRLDSWCNNQFYVITNSTAWGKASSRWKTAPVIVEGYGPSGSGMIYSNGPQQVVSFHVSAIGNGNFGSWSSLSSQDQASLIVSAKTAGYRYVLRSVTHPSMFYPGTSALFTTEWSNVGVAPAYRDWRIAYRICNQTNGALLWEGVSQLDLRSLLPTLNPTNQADAPLSVTDTFVPPAGLAAGVYALQVRITDPTGYSVPLKLAIQGVQTNGAYPMGTIEVGSSQVPPASLHWTTSSSSLTEGAGTWNQGVASLPSGAPWHNGSSYGNIMNSGDTVTFGGGTAGTGATVNNGTTLAPAKVVFLTPFSTATYYAIGTNGFNAGGTASLPSNPINLAGGVMTNASAGGATISCPVNGSFTYYSSASKVNFNGDGNQTGADTINLQLGTLQIGANAGQRGSFGAAKIINNGQVIWRRGSLAAGYSVSNAISGSGSVQYQLNTATFIILSNQTYAGSTIMTPSGSASGNNSVLKLGASDVLPTNTDFAINQTAGTISTSTLDLNGKNQTLGSLASDANATLTATVVTNSGGTASTLTLAGSSKVRFYNGNIAGNLSLALNGSGSTLTLSNACAYTGNTAINAGTLALAGAGAIASTRTIGIASGAAFSVAGIAPASYSLKGSNPQQTLSASSSSGVAAVNASGKTLAIASGALVAFKADGAAGAVGRISVTGNLTLNANAITVEVVNAALPVGAYRLLECSGALANSGTFGTPAITGWGLVPGTTASVRAFTGAAGYVELEVAGTAPATPAGFPANAIRVLPGGIVSLAGTGAVGTPFSLWAGTNVTATPVTNSWTKLTNGTITASPFTIHDPVASNYPQRFYRFSNP